MNNIDDKQIEKDFFYHCNEFEYNHDFELFFWKSDDALLEYVILYEKDYYKFLFFRNVDEYMWT